MSEISHQIILRMTALPNEKNVQHFPVSMDVGMWMHKMAQRPKSYHKEMYEGRKGKKMLYNLNKKVFSEAGRRIHAKNSF